MDWQQNLKGSRSEKNVSKALECEIKSRATYLYNAEQAREAGDEEAALLFEKMAGNEREHGKIWFKLLNDGMGDVQTNLQRAAATENHEWKTMYPSFAKQARTDGLENLAVLFEKVAAIENDHEKKFQEALVSRLQTETAAQTKIQEKPGKYQCMLCGSRRDTLEEVCPVCGALGSMV